MSFVFSLFIVRQKYLSHHMYLHTNLKLRSTNYAPVWGCLCATSIAIGWTVIFIIQPEFLTDLDARQQLINKHSALLILWYTIDWLVFGLSLAFFSFSITGLIRSQFSIKELLINLTSILSASYCISVGLAEILGLLSQMSATPYGNSQLQFQAFIMVLQKLRGSTEFSCDIWLLLLNTWLWSKKLVHKSVCLLGIIVGLLGFLILFYQFYILVMCYVALHCFWFGSISMLLLFKSDQIKESLNTQAEPHR